MKRLAVALAALIFAASCSQSTTRPPATLSGAYAMARVNDLLFITSTDRSELRAINLGQAIPDFVRAPNPLEPLSIPVVDFPDAITRDVNLNPNGDVFVGPYVYAWGQGGQQISVVSTALNSLKEVKRVTVGQPLTAVAAKGNLDPADPATIRGPSTLYYATYDTRGIAGAIRGLLWRVDVPVPDEIGAAAPLTDKVTLIRTFPGSTISAIAVFNQPGSIVVALRGGSGDVLVLNEADPTNALSLRFPPGTTQADCEKISAGLASNINGVTRAQCGFSAPVSQLEVDERTNKPMRVWGMLDVESCGRQERCTGLQAVELPANGGAPHLAEAHVPEFNDEGNVASYDVLPMTTIRPQNGAPNAFTLNPGALIVDPNSGEPTKYSLAGLVTGGTGAITVFNAGEYPPCGDIDKDHPAALNCQPALTPIDINRNKPTATNSNVSRDGGTFTGGIDPSTLRLGDGAARSERISITFGGVMGGPLPFPGAADGGASGVTALPVSDEVVPFLQVGDVVDLLGVRCNDDGADAGSSPQTTVVAAPSGIPATAQIAAAASGCTPSAYQFRASTSSPTPWVVSGAITGLMDRVAVPAEGAPSATHSFPHDLPDGGPDYDARLQRYFFYPADLFKEGGGGGPPPQITYTLLPLQSGYDAGVDDQINLDVDSQFQPLDINVDPKLYGNFSTPTFQVPTTALWSPTRSRVYVAYPSANAVLEINTQTFSSQGIGYGVNTSPYQ